MVNHKKLNEIIKEDNKIIAGLKFSSKKNLESLQSGTLYLNNFQYYRDLEVLEKRKGQGDAFDVTLKMSEVDITIKNPDTNEEIFKFKAANTNLESKEYYQKHLFCMTGITPDLLEVIEVSGNTATTSLRISEELRMNAINNFGDHVMIINIGRFLERIKNVCERLDIPYIADRVEYLDMSLNHMGRIESFNSGNPKFFFQKDRFFAYQNEYRLLFPTLVSDEPKCIDIGNIAEFTSIISTRDFLEKYDTQFNFYLTN